LGISILPIERIAKHLPVPCTESESDEEAAMPNWSKKDERMYEHIKESVKGESGDSAKAKEIAARTVNKQRREEGRTPNKTTQGTGNPNRGLEARSKDELLNRARELNVEGRSSMKKQELVEAIRRKQ
jgi:hypothetical protein